MKTYLGKLLVVGGLVMMLLAVTAPGAAASGGVYYRVKVGDTLFSLGRLYGVDAYFIADVNGLSNPNRIFAGQVLFIPSSGAGYSYGGAPYSHYYPTGQYYEGSYYYPSYSHSGSDYYVVRRGDTLASIGRRYGLSPFYIANINNIPNPNLIYSGQVLHIPQGGYYY